MFLVFKQPTMSDEAVDVAEARMKAAEARAEAAEARVKAAEARVKAAEARAKAMPVPSAPPASLVFGSSIAPSASRVSYIAPTLNNIYAAVESMNPYIPHYPPQRAPYKTTQAVVVKPILVCIPKNIPKKRL
jgi:hypothetical protein